MKTIGASGFLTSNEDDYALADFLLLTGKEWTQKGLNGMISKAITLILEAGLQAWKDANPGDPVPALPVLIPAILALPEFQVKKIETPQFPPLNRKFSPSIDDWSGGFTVEDYEDDALKAVYKDDEEMLKWAFTNKIAKRRKAFVEKYETQFINDNVTFPSIEDDFIDFTVAYPGYQNRAQRGS